MRIKWLKKFTADDTKTVEIFTIKFSMFYVRSAVNTVSLQQCDVMCFALLHHLPRPQAGLDLADMRFSQIEHAQTRLADPAADGEGQLIVQQAPVEVQVLALHDAPDFQLAQ
jgi:hypothetical protein